MTQPAAILVSAVLMVAVGPTPGYEAAIARAAKLEQDPQSEAFRNGVFLQALTWPMVQATDKCMPDGKPRGFILVFSYRGLAFDRIEASNSSRTARCMIKVLQSTTRWPQPPIDDFAASAGF